MKPKFQTWGGYLRPINLPPLSPNPLVSVLIANYNYARFLAQTLDSVLEQTYKNSEIVVCDDGSTDKSRDILQSYEENCGQIKILLRENRGQSQAILSAYKECRGEIICLLDSDDQFLPVKLEEVVKAFANAPEAGLAVHRLTATNESLRPTREVPAVAKLVSGWKAPEMSLRSPQMLWGLPPTSGLSFRRPVAERVLPCIRGRNVFCDSVIQVTAPMITPIIAIERSLGMYRVHGANAYALAKFTLEDLERMSHVDSELWRVWRSFVMTVVPTLPADFPSPPEEGLSIWDYACARKKGDRDLKAIYRRVISGAWFESMPRPYRWFWRMSYLLPDRLFELAFNSAYGKGRAKLVMARVASWFRFRRPVALPGMPEIRGGNSPSSDNDRTSASQPSFRVLGVRVDAVQLPDVIAHMEGWIARRDAVRYIAVTGMHGISQSQHDAKLRAVLNDADLVVPDGMPLVWLGNRHGFHMPRRVSGAELLESFCAQTAHSSYRHFFYGGAPGVAEQLAQCLVGRFPELQVAGTYCPPFRPLNEDEDHAIIDRIENSRADIVWVGLGAPKQEKWMFEHRNKLHAPVLVGIGAAFDFHTGRQARAPRWMRENGMEWCFRLIKEPRRLWRRYLVNGSEFVFKVMLQELGLRKFE